MQDHFNTKFQTREIIIHPGEYYATEENILVSTLLGSCIAVVLHDPVAKITGMNHFMLPEAVSGNYFLSRSGKYGMQAMELLINAMGKMGIQKSRLVAKVFGGGAVIATGPKNNVATSNINFALDYLEVEEIPVIAADLGGTFARKVLVLTHENRVLLKKLERQHSSSMKAIEKEELSYQKSIIEEEGHWGDVISFK